MVAYETLSSNSKVWVYQSNKPFSEAEAAQVKAKIADFVQRWASHNNQLKAYGDLFNDRFIVLMVDESAAGASGCSIDESVRFVQGIEKNYNADMFDRLNFTYRTAEGNIKSAHKEEFVELYKMGIITDETVVFNTLVSTKAEFDSSFETKLSESWHKMFV
jgi:hypothetical protein